MCIASRQPQVSNSYVMKKVVVILYPPSNKVWNRLQADEFERDGEVSTSTVELTAAEGVSHDFALIYFELLELNSICVLIL